MKADKIKTRAEFITQMKSITNIYEVSNKTVEGISDAIYALYDDIDEADDITDENLARIAKWSSCKPEEYSNYIELFRDNGIRVDYFNENPECANTAVGAFDTKFYFSVLLDDKAGFDPSQDWYAVRSAVSNEHYKMESK